MREITVKKKIAAIMDSVKANQNINCNITVTYLNTTGELGLGGFTINYEDNSEVDVNFSFKGSDRASCQVTGMIVGLGKFEVLAKSNSLFTLVSILTLIGATIETKQICTYQLFDRLQSGNVAYRRVYNEQTGKWIDVEIQALKSLLQYNMLQLRNGVITKVGIKQTQQISLPVNSLKTPDIKKNWQA